LADGEPADVAAAIDEHYMPRAAGGVLPSTGIGIAVALADKLATLAGIFAIGQKPSGTKDPFGLRRAAIGVLRILIEKKLELDLRGLVASAVEQQPVKSATAAAELWDYMVERLRSYFIDASAQEGVRGISTEMFDAVPARGPGPAPIRDSPRSGCPTRGATSGRSARGRRGARSWIPTSSRTRWSTGVRPGWCSSGTCSCATRRSSARTRR
jgi:hypothetical protein